MIDLQTEIAAIVEAEQPKPVLEPVETEQAPAPETAEQEPEKPSEEPKAEKTFTQAELDKIVQKEKAKLERRNERQRIESETRLKVQSEQQQPIVELGEKPIQDNYSTYEDYLEALAEYKAVEIVEKREAAKKQQESEKLQQAEIERQSDRRRTLLEVGEDKYDDFEDVVKGSKLQIAEPAYLAMLESDISADLVYHLAKNDDEAERISKMSPYAQAKEIGKLEDKLAAKQPIKKSDAPKPITPVSGSKDFTKRYEDMTIAEIEADAVKRGARWT